MEGAKHQVVSLTEYSEYSALFSAFVLVSAVKDYWIFTMLETFSKSDLLKRGKTIEPSYE